jgi:ribonucleoside-diphosphate reductase alpha chain
VAQRHRSSRSTRAASARAAVCAYLETWHLDIEEFLELRKNTGDDRRRTHDMNTANWIPDLFMKRVMEAADVDALLAVRRARTSTTFGTDFEKAYVAYEKPAPRRAQDLRQEDAGARARGRKMLAHAVRDRPSVDHLQGPVQRPLARSSTSAWCTRSNLCTEITLNTSDERDRRLQPGLGQPATRTSSADGLASTTRSCESTVTRRRCACSTTSSTSTSTRPRPREISNLRHRPVGMGIMGLQDCLLPAATCSFAAEAAVEFDDEIDGSRRATTPTRPPTDLAAERGTYSAPTRAPSGTAACCRRTPSTSSRRSAAAPSRSTRRPHGLGAAARQDRRSTACATPTCLAIAPTATISNIVGSSACIEPTYKNLFVKSNLSGEFTELNGYLVRDLKKLGLWNQEMMQQIKYFDGELKDIAEIPQAIKDKYLTRLRPSRTSGSSTPPPVARSGSTRPSR